MIDAILGFLSKPFTAWIEKREARKYMKEEGNLRIQKAKVDLTVAKHEAKAQRLLKNTEVDAEYDLQAQMEKRHSFSDEILLIATVILVGAHFFFPASLAAGWAAMGYAAGAPWWLEFIIVGIYISVFGLMRLFRAWSPFGKQRRTKDD